MSKVFYESVLTIGCFYSISFLEEYLNCSIFCALRMCFVDSYQDVTFFSSVFFAVFVSIFNLPCLYNSHNLNCFGRTLFF